jgi:5-methylcytosine-specific restriction endonuclease McrA
MSRARRRTILAIVETDATFEQLSVRGQEVWQGKCLHCGGHLLIALDGEPISRATIEHIVPRTAGGGDELGNLALACARCNQGKGKRHDHRFKSDPRARELVDRLLARRRERWREPAGASRTP